MIKNNYFTKLLTDSWGSIDWPAGAVVGTRRVDALVLAARGIFGALVDIFAVRLDGRLRITFVTYALVRAHQVLASAVTADTLK